MTNKTNPPDTLVGLLAWATGPDVREAILEQLRAMKAAFDGRPAALASKPTPLMANGLTEEETSATASVSGLSSRPVQGGDAVRLLQFARSVLGPDWETGDGENEPFRLWCAEVDALLLGQPVQTAEHDTEDEFRWPNAVTEPPQPVQKAEDEQTGEQRGPIAEGWQISICDGHSGYGVYAHHEDAEDEGAVLVALVPPPAALASKPVQGGERLKKAAQAVLDRWNSPKWEWHKQGPTADLMAELNAAMSSAPAQPVREPIWQPIETAPAERGLYLVRIGDQTHIAQFDPRMSSAKWWSPYGLPARLERQPTHWMPLPAAPGITKE